MKNPSDVSKKWGQRLSAATQQIQQGVSAVTQNPAEKAAQRQDAYVQGIQRAVLEGKWQRGLRRVTLQDWQQAMIQKGLPRIASGAQGAVSKVEQFMTKWLPHMEAGKRMLDSMSRGDLEQNINRMTAMVRHAATFKG